MQNDPISGAPILRPPFPGRRIVVVGTSGAGKTTLAASLAQRLAVPHVELDSIYWGPNWTPIPEDLFRARAAQATASEGWVADGDYRKVRNILLSRADTLVWLDYSLPIIFWRLTRRILRRGIKREELWQGNRETVWPHFFTRDSLYLFVLKTHRRRRRTYSAILASAEYPQLTGVRLRTPRETREWLANLPENR